MISIVVPVYNVEKYIEKCLESIVKQSYKDFELLLINDGSTDNSTEVINKYLTDKNLNWKLINKENGGLASARNFGINESKGEYISFIDSDDCLTEDFIENLLFLIKQDNYDFSFCNYKYVSEQTIEKDSNNETKEFNRNDLLISFLRRTVNFVVPSMMFNKDFLLNNNLFFDEKIRFSEDQPFIWNCILHSEKANYSYKKMYGYYLRESSIMTSSSLDKIKKSYEEYSKYITNIFKPYKQLNAISKLIIPRWQLGALYTSARILDFKEFVEIYNFFDGKTLLKRIIGISEIKAYALAFVSSISCLLLYKLSNVLNLNK